MAFQVFRAPEIWSSANRPLEFILGSERQPNTDPDESGIAIVSITQNDPVIVGNFGVNPADVIVFASTILLLEVGQYVLIENTALRLYSGTYRVTAVYGNGDSDRLVQLLTVDDGSGCPGEMAVALWLDGADGLIVREEEEDVGALGARRGRCLGALTPRAARHPHRRSSGAGRRR